ncbi:MAG: LysM peptidoglycan-binding domain-containing protein [Pseudomonadota bacterium]
MSVSRTRLLLKRGSFVIFGLGISLGASFTSAADAITIREDQPSSYTVVRGDTLWDIAGRFLEEPWQWPRVWEKNPQIANPDLIYPGDVITLEYVDGQPVLRLSRADTEGLRTVRLSPGIRREPIGGPIQAIPLEKISAYLSPDYVVSTEAYENAPYIMAERFGNTVMSPGDRIFARGDWTPGVYTYDIIHNGRDLVDPDTGENLGIEGIKIGSATISKTNGQEAVLEIESVLREVRVGDRFIVSETATLDPDFMPLPPDFAVDGAIVALGSGNSVGGLYDTLILNKGSANGIEIGQLLTVQEPDVEVTDPMTPVKMFDAAKKAMGKEVENVVNFPGETIGTVLVYKVFDKASFGLVLKTNKEVRMGDRVVTPN